MKRLIYTLLGAAFVLTSCFKDEGNYDYHELNAPHWMADYKNNPATYVGNAGGKISFKGSKLFVWDDNAEDRSSKVRYEWHFNNKLVSEDLDFVMSVEELMEKSGIKEYNASSPYVGTFSVVDKETEVSFIARLQVWLNPYFAPYDWFILADDNGKTNVASLRVQENPEVNPQEWYELEDYAYEKHNKGASIPGKPLFMSWSFSPHVSSQGSVTVITDQVAYELEGDDLEFYGDMKDLFLDGTPAGFQPIARADIDRSQQGVPPCTFLLSKDGKVYTRVMTANYLGGKFLSEPYELDNKEYEMAFFGQGRYGSTIPSYDAKNRRVVMSCVWREEINHGGGQGDVTSAYRINMVPVKKNGNLTLPIYEMPENSEVLRLSSSSHISWGIPSTSQVYTIFYTDPAKANTTTIADFLVDNRSMIASNPYSVNYTKMDFPKKLTKDNIILTSGNTRTASTSMNAKYRTYISVGKKLYYFDRNRTPMQGNITASGCFPTNEFEFPSNITCLNYNFYTCDKLFVGCENGEIFIYNVTYNGNPQLEFKGKMKGKIISTKQPGLRTSGNDMFL